MNSSIREEEEVRRTRLHAVDSIEQPSQGLDLKQQNSQKYHHFDPLLSYGGLEEASPYFLASLPLLTTIRVSQVLPLDKHSALSEFTISV